MQVEASFVMLSYKLAEIESDDFFYGIALHANTSLTPVPTYYSTTWATGAVLFSKGYYIVHRHGLLARPVGIIIWLYILGIMFWRKTLFFLHGADYHHDLAHNWAGGGSDWWLSSWGLLDPPPPVMDWQLGLLSLRKWECFLASLTNPS